MRYITLLQWAYYGDLQYSRGFQHAEGSQRPQLVPSSANEKSHLLKVALKASMPERDRVSGRRHLVLAYGQRL